MPPYMQIEFQTLNKCKSERVLERHILSSSNSFENSSFQSRRSIFIALRQHEELSISLMTGGHLMQRLIRTSYYSHLVNLAPSPLSPLSKNRYQFAFNKLIKSLWGPLTPLQHMIMPPPCRSLVSRIYYACTPDCPPRISLSVTFNIICCSVLCSVL